MPSVTKPLPFLFCALAGVACQPASPLRLNEFMAANTSSLMDETGAFVDWVELHNQGDEDLSLEGFFLTDDLDQGDLAPLDPDLLVPAGGFLVLWADKGEVESPFHLPFALSADGEELGLFERRGERLVELDWAFFGPQREDISMARIPDGEDPWVEASQPTPGASNGNAGSGAGK
jgi:hypothetical protein